MSGDIVKKEGDIVVGGKVLPDIFKNIKPFWKSKTFWAILITGLIGLYNSLVPETGLPPVPDIIISILAALGLYTGRRLVVHDDTVQEYKH